MHRIILFLVLVTLAAAGAAWVAEQGGDVALTWHGWRVETTLPVFALALGATIVAAMLVWSALSALWRTPGRIRRTRRERRLARGRHAITHGLLASGRGDQAAARAHATVARRHAAPDPLSLLLHAPPAPTRPSPAAMAAVLLLACLCTPRPPSSKASPPPSLTLSNPYPSARILR